MGRRAVLESLVLWTHAPWRPGCGEWLRPVARYFVLPIYDDEPALYRSIGTGMRRKRPRFRLLHLTVQTQGIVAVVAAGCGGLAASPAGSVIAWLVAALAFLVTMVTLFVYWHRSLADMRAAIRPIHPTPTDRLNVPIGRISIDRSIARQASAGYQATSAWS